MKFCIIVFAVLVSINASAAGCLDISGTYDSNFYGGMPKCAQGINVVKSWLKYKQVECQILTYSKIYKLENETYCESPKSTFVTDGQERQSANPEYSYKVQLFQDRQILTLKAVATGNQMISTKTLDSNGNLVVDGNSGYCAAFLLTGLLTRVFKG